MSTQHVTPPHIWMELPPNSGTWVELDPHNVALPLEITMGRSGTTLMPDAPTCSFDWLGDVPPFQLGTVIRITLDLPVYTTDRAKWADSAVNWGSGLTTWVGEDVQTIDRFAGYITDLKAMESDGVVYGWQVHCTGVAALLGQTPVRMTRPAETDADRINAIAAKAGVSVAIIGGDYVNLVADNIDADALSAMQEICDSSGGIVVQLRNGLIAYGTRGHRDVDATRELPDSVILDGIEWYQNVNELLNHVVVTFGWEPPQPEPGIWNHSSNTSMGDPGSGNFRVSAGLDQLSISRYALDGTDYYAYFSEFEDSDYAAVREKADSEHSAVFTVTNIVNGGSWFLMNLDVHDQQGGGLSPNVDVIFDWTLSTTQTQNTYRDDASIDEWGFRHAEINTMLAQQSDADEMGNTVLARRATPYWVIPGILCNSDDMSVVEYRNINEMQVGVGLLLKIPVAPGPIGEVESWSVEGWVERWEKHNQQLMQLSVSDRQRWGAYALRRWSGQAEHTWQFWVDYTWLEQLTRQEL